MRNIASIRPASGRACSSCKCAIADRALVFADRDGTIWCSRCAPLAGTVREGFDCPDCSNAGLHAKDCPGCPHFPCQAYAVRGIIPDDPDPAYASCPGAPRDVVRVQEFVRALRAGLPVTR